MANGAWEQGEQVLRNWRSNAELARTAHRIAGKHFARQHNIMGGILVCLSALLGTSLITQVKTHPIGEFSVMLVGVAVFILSALQTFRKPHEKAETHESCRSGFASLCRQIETTLAVPLSDRGTPDDVLEKIRTRYDELSSVHAPVPERLWRKAERGVGRNT